MNTFKGGSLILDREFMANLFRYSIVDMVGNARLSNGSDQFIVGHKTMGSHCIHESYVRRTQSKSCSLEQQPSAIDLECRCEVGVKFEAQGHR